MLIKIHPENPSPRLISQVIECLNDGGIIIFPTDTLYAVGCDIRQQKTAQKLAELKGTKIEKANFSVICDSFSRLSDYTIPINNSIFRIMKQCLPGPYTFILEANNKVPRIFQNKKRTIGIRIPNNPIVQHIVQELSSPLLSTSIHIKDTEDEYHTNPELLDDIYGDKVDIIIDGGISENEPSTVLDCSLNNMEVIRYGKGVVDFLSEG